MNPRVTCLMRAPTCRTGLSRDAQRMRVLCMISHAATLHTFPVSSLFQCAFFRIMHQGSLYAPNLSQSINYLHLPCTRSFQSILIEGSYTTKTSVFNMGSTHKPSGSYFFWLRKTPKKTGSLLYSRQDLSTFLAFL